MHTIEGIIFEKFPRKKVKRAVTERETEFALNFISRELDSLGGSSHSLATY